MEQGLKDAYNLSDADGSATGTWINTGGHRLRLELMDSLGDEHAAEKLISWCEDEGKPFERLVVNKI